MKKLFSVLAIAVISFSTVQAQEVVPTNSTKKQPKSVKKTAEVVKKETPSEKQAEVKTVTSAEAPKAPQKHTSEKHKEDKAK